MEIKNPSITILVGSERTTIEIRDNDSVTTFCRVELNPNQLSSALSRVGHTPCKVSVYELDRIGKQHQNEDFVFEIPEHLRGSQHSEKLFELCKIKLAVAGKSDYTPDDYFASQNSFFTKEGQSYARTTIRRWI